MGPVLVVRWSCCWCQWVNLNLRLIGSSKFEEDKSERCRTKLVLDLCLAVQVQFASTVIS